jgi:hypothetical protein
LGVAGESRPFAALRTHLSSGREKFDTVFQGHWNAAEAVRIYQPKIRKSNGVSLQIIGADFNLRGISDFSGNPLGVFAQGKVYPDILDKLVRLTEDEQRKDQKLVILWALHFPPGFPNLSQTMKLIDEASLIKAANKCGVTAILVGHTHIPARYRTPGMKFDVCCAGSATQYLSQRQSQPPDGNYLHLLRILVDDQMQVAVTCDNYRFAKDRGFISA